MIGKITVNPLFTAVLAFLIAGTVIGILSRTFYASGDFREGILVESHGMLLDILVFGILILWLNRIGEKRLEIRRYEEEINDYRDWTGDEASTTSCSADQPGTGS